MSAFFKSLNPARDKFFKAHQPEEALALLEPLLDDAGVLSREGMKSHAWSAPAFSAMSVSARCSESSRPRERSPSRI